MNFELLRRFTFSFMLLELCFLLPDLDYVFGALALVPVNPGSPYGLFLNSLSGIGLGRHTAVLLHWAMLMGLLLPGLFGKARMFSDVVAWLLVALWIGAWNLGVYGVHFYFVFCCLIFVFSHFTDGRSLSFGAKILFGLTYFNTGISKILTPEWRSGEALDVLLRSPELGNFPQLHLGVCWVIISWFIILIQLTYPLTSFLPRARRPLFFLVTATHLVAAVTVDLLLFSFFLVGLNYIFLEQDFIRSGK